MVKPQIPGFFACQRWVPDIYVKRIALQYEIASLYICDAGLDSDYADFVQVCSSLIYSVGLPRCSGIMIIAKINGVPSNLIPKRFAYGENSAPLKNKRADNRD